MFLPYPSDAAAVADAGTEALRVPPHSLEAEQAVLGGLMLDNAAWDTVADRVVEEDFYRGDHRLIFRAIRTLAEQGSPLDVVTLAEWLERSALLDDAGGLPYLATLARDTPSAANIRAYADIVRERSVLRQLIRVGTDIAGRAYQPEGRSSKELLDEAEREVFAIAEQGSRQNQGFQPIKDLLTRAVDRIDTLFERDDPITGVPTGWSEFDEMTAGLQSGELIIVAGRPSMGKTTFAMNIVEHAAIKENRPVAVFSMEMPADHLALRMMSSLGRIDQHRIRTGKLEDEDWPRLTSAVSLLAEAKLFIDDTAALSPTEVRARCRRLAREHGQLGLVMLDYLQLMQVPGNSENRATEISEISRSLKALAKELHVPVIALSQLNRSLEQRPNKRPVMSDLRESGAIEQDADLICFIYRDEVYHPDSADKGTAEIIIGKQRNGPIGSVRLTFLGKYTRFENFMPDVYAADEYA
ncbi:replicative DNA helicase [Plasticicumulans sp.]|uniref:replicative DNA helicase n=1 Tax=Plasticicumulans sp. TaxID=2307179 RepID=UPI002CE8AC70|nr:replicative DNA helicase [Plasticicumulans sp.]HMZ10326.1 replicative DNA helicase [Plasticicumulans sp.]HNF65125.1 replicative DNA helicase [Plasticicumulans sp.]HNG48616.1 replicative DNA helicase [Plasticicumulans sp.]HNI22921.1 replicative DNA helicase [Plasticicumulans sp.]HNJ08524.1 replicative DNA helicase [Plasticicumulans sp.]